jgi:hypothetical protein
MSVFPSKVNYATGDILTATDMNEIGQAINLLDGAQFAAGKNKIINGDMGVWQRGTSFSNPVSGTFLADRYALFYNGTGATRTITQQTFTPGTAPVSGYEGQYFFRYAKTVAGSGCTVDVLTQRIEDVRTVAGQTITVSFWAKASGATTLDPLQLDQNFGSGGSTSVTTTVGASVAVTTAWQRFTYTVACPSISGKTLGAGNYLGLALNFPIASTYTVDIWGVQLEAASSVSNFQTSTGTKQGELSACQYFYRRVNAPSTTSTLCIGEAVTTGQFRGVYYFNTPMRTAPTFSSSAASTFTVYSKNAGSGNATPVQIDATTNASYFYANSASATLTAGNAVSFGSQAAGAFLEWSSEL